MSYCKKFFVKSSFANARVLVERGVRSRNFAQKFSRSNAVFGVAVKSVIVHQHSVLLLRRAQDDRWRPGEWDLPGGRLYLNEMATNGLRREVFEETGMRIEDPTPIRVWNFVDHDMPVIGITFLSMCGDAEIRLSSEHYDYRWVNLDEFDRLSFPDHIKADILSMQNLIQVGKLVSHL